MIEILRSMPGLMRSCRIYYGDKARSRRMDALYRRFIAPGDLVFDVGAHVGDRTASFRRLGARVVSVEPQPAPALLLRLLYGRDRNVTIKEMAVGAVEGTVGLHINRGNPTVSTASAAFIAATRSSPNWVGEKWTSARTVPMTTLGRLITEHGKPAFIKIDVEGFEAEVLSGLPGPVPALSFEFTTIQRDVAQACIRRLEGLGNYAFNASLGESMNLEFEGPCPASIVIEWLEQLPHTANSGDVYCMLQA